MTLQDGDIILVKVNSFSTWYRQAFAKLIQFFDGVYYHHAQIVFGGYLWEANERVESHHFAKNAGDEVLILRLKQPLTEIERALVRNEIMKSNGKQYDYWGAMLHQLIYILLFRRVWIGRRGRRADHKPYCTELVTSIMHQVRGYFPEHYKVGPSKLITQAPLYYEVIYEGVWR